MRAKTSLADAPRGMMIPYFRQCFQLRCDLDGGPKVAEGHHVLAGVFRPTTVAYVTMLRDPFERIVSGFDDGRHDCRRCPADVDLVHYGRNEGIVGIYARFLLGSRARIPELTGSVAVSRAADRLRQFAFVGIVEDWDDAICLLHAKFGRRQSPPPINAEFATLRRSAKHGVVTLKARAATLRRDAETRGRRGNNTDSNTDDWARGGNNTDSNTDDWALVDLQLYNVALDIFHRDLRLFTTSRPSASYALDDEMKQE
mmetsp:Transcript_7390/g.24363  ORF Transcript_7390/g.24363 Transcript_7390/m.24363 type:complete len:257 (-) Transcript_7390:1273-2043(-)